MDPRPDPLLSELRAGLRAALTGLPALPGLHGAPVLDGAGGPTRAALDSLGAAELERPVRAGGLALGLIAGVVVSEELGRAARGNAYRADALAADVGGPSGAAIAGVEALPLGSGVRLDGFGRMTGAALVDGPADGPLLVAAQSATGPVLVALPRGVPASSPDGAGWPQVVRFEDRCGAKVLARLDATPDGPLARARVRQAGYLLGLAEGAHRLAVGYAAQRTQFGTPLLELAPVSFPLAQAEVALRATRAAVHRAAFEIDNGAAGSLTGSDLDVPGTAPAAALAMAGETARQVIRSSMQGCGVRALTGELALHRYFRLVTGESARYGEPAALWREVGAAVLGAAARLAADRRTGADDLAASVPAGV